MFRSTSCRLASWTKKWTVQEGANCVRLSGSSSHSSEDRPRKTCLYSLHEKHNGKMVTFAGFLMPIQYGGVGIVDSHVHTRCKASLFDVSHMLQTKVHGRHRVEFVESLTVADVQGLREDQSTLTLFTNDNGGIIDDLIVSKTSNDYLYVVSNAGCIDKDKNLMDAQLYAFRAKGKDVSLEYMDTSGLVALQGPLAASALQNLVEYDLTKQGFMTTKVSTVAGVNNCRITRCGYTGEDGFELSVPSERAEHIVDTLLGSLEPGCVQLAGLGARDTLRLEAGLCLYGNEMDETVTPVEAGLVWTIGKRRRQLADFPGAQSVLKQIKEKPKRKRVGLASLNGGPAARGQTLVQDENGQTLGQVTSGCPSPTLSRNICMAYVPTAASALGTKLVCQVRGKAFPYEVVKMPFVPAKYYVI
ncbi:Aminomethyltransferase, mitochondrial [Halotydeus destructor]|nr:Aminomethyltransferase, mitochondrial [Halotydeus destructor]